MASDMIKNAKLTTPTPDDSVTNNINQEPTVPKHLKAKHFKPVDSTLKPPCKRCIRARWLMTVLMLTAMAVIVYLDQAPK